MEPAQQRAAEDLAAGSGPWEPESGSPGRRSQAESGEEPSGGGGQLDGNAAGGPRRRRGGAGGFAPPATLAACGTPAGPGRAGSANSLLLRRGRLKRNLSAAAPSLAGAPASSLGTHSLDRKALLLLKPPRQLQPLQPQERDWVRRDLQRGCVHVYERHMNCYLRPVLCTVETTAAEVAARLQQLGHRGGSSVVRMLGKVGPPLPQHSAPEPPAGPAEAPPEPAAEGLRPQPEERPRSRPGTRSGLSGGSCGEAARPHRLLLGSAAEESDFAGGRPSLASSDFSHGAPPAELYLAEPPLSCPSLLGELGPAGSDTESFSPSGESVSDRLDPYSSGGGGSGSSSSEELEVEPAPLDRVEETGAGLGRGPRCLGELSPGRAGGLPAGPAGEREPPAGPLALYVQLHGETSRRLEAHEKPLQIQNDYLSQLGFRDLWRVQEEGMDSETGCLIRFYAGTPDAMPTYLNKDETMGHGPRGNRRWNAFEVQDPGL
ncbi:PH domain leucine-rich repeat-containing protein phosphatase 1-like protein [Willisornis vidua]|uniref:PH domain leucine-rich repeat-containing protein phosphatase 1-like protein n=1 Tax=Willisornis vidua TaxID=1566151 RepID=A0ABQ9D3N0_9PASS|nr:PH domain leucine-rich repeat-containing protein phosphatase 1-like protein [Willisornis vidua]